MGNREDLLAGARRCLYSKGYAATTARDIASEAGVSLAAIGYHYGTKEKLLNAALLAALGEWGEELGRLAAVPARRGATAVTRFEDTWAGVLRSFAAHGPLWSVQFELLGQLEHNAELRATFAAANHSGRLALAELFGHDIADEASALRAGALYQALLGGVAAQWMVDPDAALRGSDLVAAIRALAAQLAGGRS